MDTYELEKESDPLDIASRNESIERISALHELSKLVPKPKPELDHEIECDCGQEIPVGRAKLGYTNCIYCQEAIDRKKRQDKMRG